MKRKRDKYTSKDIQNEMMKAAALQVFREIAAEIHIADFYFIMADEAINVANISQLTLCICWVENNLDCHEDFIGFYSLDAANADTIVAVIKDVIL